MTDRPSKESVAAVLFGAASTFLLVSPVILLVFF